MVRTCILQLRRRKRRGGLFVSEMRFPWGRQEEEASYPRIFLKAIHMEVARRKVGDYYETEEKLTHSVAVVAKGRSRGAV